MRLTQKSARMACLVLLCLGVSQGACGGDEEPSQTKNNTKNNVNSDMGDKLDMPTPDMKPGDDMSPDMNMPKDMGGDGAEHDMADMSSGPQIRTIKDYRRCQGDNDCPVGLGRCVKEVALSHIGVDGAEKVALSTVFEGLGPDEGVCTEVCTNDATVCGTLTLNSPLQDPNKHTCQVVALGQAPYPDQAPAFPFADQLDPAQLKAGQPFGAICRPPFEMAPSIPDDMCKACEPGATECGQGSACWSAFTSQLSQGGEAGVCVIACDENNACPLGFSCDALGDQGESFCVPSQGTCTACLDRDGDGRGAGQCGQGAQPKTPYDCDDLDAQAYYDDMTPTHAFPGLCGEFDKNCNGLSDAAEQVGSADFGEDHCTACGDTCAGPVPNGQRTCAVLNHDGGQSAQAGRCQASCTDPLQFADCDGDISNGCETAVQDASRLYYRDADGDGHGDPNDVKFACDPAQAPAGYVRSDNSDCNDGDNAIYGAGVAGNAAVEVCDNKDNNCDGQVDNQTDLAGTACQVAANQGVCRDGVYSCDAGGILTCNTNQPSEEICNDNLDNNCDGFVDNVVAVTPTNGARTYYADNDQDGYGSENATPVYACPGQEPARHVTNNQDCNDNSSAIYPGRLEICDGVDNNCDNAIDNVTTLSGTGAVNYYIDGDGDGYGKKNASASLLCPVGGNPPPGYSANRTDCDDSQPTVYPGRLEICDGLDNNCDNAIDNVTTTSGTSANVFYADGDGDGYGRQGATALYRCAPISSPPAGLSASRNDCNDSNASVNPGESEICNRIDDNCSAGVDETCIKTIDIPTSGTRVSIDTNGDGQLDSNFFGNGTGPEHDLKCADGKAVRQLSIDSNAGRVIRVKIRCSGAVVKETSPSPYQSLVDTNDSDVDGGGFGRNYTEVYGTKDLSCDGDSFLRRVKIKHGPVVGYGSILALEAECHDITVRMPPPGSSQLEMGTSTSASDKWGDYNAGGSNYDVTCPAGQVVTGFRFKAWNNQADCCLTDPRREWISKMGVYCSPMNPDYKP